MARIVINTFQGGRNFFLNLLHRFEFVCNRHLYYRRRKHIRRAFALRRGFTILLGVVDVGKKLHHKPGLILLLVLELLLGKQILNQRPARVELRHVVWRK